jgi:hypothetical protein
LYVSKFLKIQVANMNSTTDNNNNTRKVSLRSYLNQLFHASKKSAEKRKAKGRVDAGQHDISLAFLESVWEQQNGRCYYSNIEMQVSKNEWKVSLERIDPSKGYTQDNTVLCCLEFNTRSQWSFAKIDDMLSILNQNIENVDNDFPKIPKKSKYDKVLQIEQDGEVFYRCTQCKVYKKTQDFRKIGEVCRKCANIRAKISKHTPRGHMIALCHSSMNAAKMRGKKDTERSKHDIDFEFLIQLYKEQKGLCAYSGLPLKFGSYLDNEWTASLERIDVTKGYTKDNVCLVCIEFNGPDHSITTGPEYGCAGWNALKFQYFLAHIQHKKGLISDEELQAVISIQEQFKEKETYIGTPKKYGPPNRKDVIDAIHRQKRKYENAHEHYGHIYIITSPSGKQFVGQSHLLYHKKDTTLFGHARKFGYTSLLREAEEYGEDNMNIEVIACCRKDVLDHYQDYFIDVFDTLEPNGLNNRTRQTHEVRKRISQTLVDNAIRYDVDGTQLPKYVKYVDWKDRRGYAIISHPNCKKKDFVSKRKPLETLKQECMAYLASLD